MVSKKYKATIMEKVFSCQSNTSFYSRIEKLLWSAMMAKVNTIESMRATLGRVLLWKRLEVKIMALNDR